MRIVSNKKDYYDCGKANDRDNSVIYVRNEYSKDINGPIFPAATFGKPKPWAIGPCLGVSFGINLVGFCGKLYACLRPYSDLTYGPIPNEDPNGYCWSEQQVLKYIQKHISSDSMDRFVKRQNKDNSILNFFSYYESIKDKFSGLFEAPIFVIDSKSQWIHGIQFYGLKENNHIIYNCLLNKYKFERLFDPMTAYQELLMYMNNKAAPEKPIPKITDVEMAESKGFNKFSFRKDKSK